MGDFDTALENTASKFLDVFGASDAIVVYPDGVTGRSITAIIDYGNVEQVAGMPHGKAQVITITVANNATTGLATSEFNRADAKVDIPPQIGKSAVSKRIQKIISQDAGMVTYEVQ